MRPISVLTRLLLSAAMAFLLLIALPASAQDEPENATDVWDIARGGQLYDNWMSVLDADVPEGSHPLYPADGKKQGKDSWRCKECHGWDYRGKDGAYSSGSHFTGIIGISGLAGANEADIAAAITSDDHAFADKLNASSVAKLAKFIASGQIDTDEWIDRSSKQAKGDPAKGARLYQTICAVCHGFNGTDINFKTEESPEFVGTVAADNPWETIHKIRFGQPGVGMIALGGLDMQTMVDILAYTQTLPAK